jgi:hypothetical protein
MCQVKVCCTGRGGGASGAVVVGLVCLAATGLVSVIGTVLASVAAVLSSLVWAAAAVGGVGVLAVSGVYVVREVLAYRADRADAEQVMASLVARGITVAPTPLVPPIPVGPMVAAGGRLSLAVGRGGAR